MSFSVFVIVVLLNGKVEVLRDVRNITLVPNNLPVWTTFPACIIESIRVTPHSGVISVHSLLLCVWNIFSRKYINEWNNPKILFSILSLVQALIGVNMIWTIWLVSFMRWMPAKPPRSRRNGDRSYGWWLRISYIMLLSTMLNFNIQIIRRCIDFFKMHNI